MRKLESIFTMLKWISVAPGVSAETLAQLVDRSERGVYRYLSDLKGLGIAIKCQNGGYTLEDSDIMSAIKLTEGIKRCRQETQYFEVVSD